VSKSV
jgi:hypothetical protein